jgi:hypothetical protein
MGLTNLGLVPAGVAPVLTLSPALPTPEGTANGNTVSHALTLTRNGVAGPVAFGWSVAGSGANPASANDFAGGTYPSGSGIFAPGEIGKTIAFTFAADATVEPDEGYAVTVTASVPLATVSAPGTILNDDVPPPPGLLMGSRYNQPGFNGYGGSDGGDTDSNSRIGSYNETGATVTRLRAYFVNWFANPTSEQDGFNPITITAAIEYPAGTLTRLTFGGAPSTVIPPTGAASLAESDEVTLATAIPAGALYWVRTYVAVSAGGKWPQAYRILDAALGAIGLDERVDFSTGVDRTTGAAIANVAASPVRRGYGPVAVKATGFVGTPVARAFAAVGDSLMMGATDVHDPAATGHGNIGYFAKAAATSYPVVNLGIAGTAAANNLPAAFGRRAALLGRIGVTHVFCNWSINDVIAGRSAAQLANDVAAIAAGFKAAAGVRVIWSTLTPRTAAPDAWRTTANQTAFATPAGAFTGGAASVRSQFNAMLRTGIAGVDAVFDAADIVETARDSGIWRAGDGSTHLTGTGASSDAATNDGLHPTAFNTSGSGLGGVYILRDAVRAAFSGW